MTTTTERGGSDGTSSTGVASLSTRPGAPGADPPGAGTPRPDTPGPGGRSGAGARRRPQLARPLGIGLVGLWLSVLVLLPLAALTVTSLGEGFSGFW
jgi:sulfate/thiosulfate transport system permease protein